MKLRLELSLFWYKPSCFSHVNDAVLMLIGRNLFNKSSEASINTRSTPVSLSFKCQATKHTTVLWSIFLSYMFNWFYLMWRDYYLLSNYTIKSIYRKLMQFFKLSRSLVGCKYSASREEYIWVTYKKLNHRVEVRVTRVN